MKKILAALALLSAAAAAPVAASAAELGVLDCQVDGGRGFIIGSRKGVACTFRPYDKAFMPETYTGVISKLGIDVGHTSVGSLSWAVLAATHGVRGGTLAGNYYGTNAEATIVTGGGANLLVGGFQGAITLQPLSVQAQTGLNLAVAVQKMELYRPLK